MKKAIKILVPVMILVIALSISASAFSGINEFEQKILDYLVANGTFKVGGETYEVNEAHIARAYNYFNRDDVDLTEQVADTVETNVENLTEKVEKMDTEDISTLTDTQKTEIITEMQEAVEVLDLKVELDVAKDQITIVDNNGQVLAASTNTIKPTGAASTASVAVVAVVAIMGCALVLTKKRVHE